MSTELRATSTLVCATWDEKTGRFDRSDVALPVLTKPGVLATEPCYVDVSEDAPWDHRAAIFLEKIIE
ncbi:hypothetical protein [Nocardia xishanensis]|uniref:hypothetical protein n=1 Tax=Nocardia xishanensis TaxID=238964 RepID=UPI00082ECD51|nr:hypothetical protein [Nocardia xishanensis]